MHIYLVPRSSVDAINHDTLFFNQMGATHHIAFECNPWYIAKQPFLE